MPIKELTEPRIIKNLQRIKKKLYAELSVLEINFIDTDETEEFDNSNLELEIDQLHQMIRSIDKAIHLIKKGPDVSTLLRSVKTLPSEIKPDLSKEDEAFLNHLKNVFSKEKSHFEDGGKTLVID